MTRNGEAIADPPVIEILRSIIGNANEAPRFGPFDQIDNTGEPYQSEAFAKALERGRKYLAGNSYSRSPPAASEDMVDAALHAWDIRGEPRSVVRAMINAAIAAMENAKMTPKVARDENL